jgi:fermentation-respiration switch protein FrsA (DUF1100 family)
MKKYKKVILIILFVIAILIIIAGFVVGNMFYNLALNPTIDKSSVLNAPHNVGDNAADVDSSGDIEKTKSEEWFKNIGFKDLYIQTFDDLKLHAYSIQNTDQSNKYAIICHGYGGQGSLMTKSASRFYSMGFNVLLPDARGQGKSEGNYIGMGWHDRLDVVSWIDDILEKDSEAEIILYGVSMGGATVMMASGENLPENVKAIVEDCGYTSVWDEFSYQLKEIFNLPAFPFMNFSSAVTKLRAGYTLGEASALDQVVKSNTPMMFIHGGSDTFVPSLMFNEVYDAAKVPKEKLYVKGAGHGESSNIAGEMYWKKVENFLYKYLD